MTNKYSYRKSYPKPINCSCD